MFRRHYLQNSIDPLTAEMRVDSYISCLRNVKCWSCSRWCSKVASCLTEPRVAARVRHANWLSGIAKPSPATPDKILIVFQYHGKKQMGGIFLNQITNAARKSLETLESEYLFNDCDTSFNDI
jgi:hypothetical protein